MYGSLGVHLFCFFPEEQAFLQVMQLPRMKEEEVGNAIRAQAENYIPYPVETVYLDSAVIPPFHNHIDHMDVLLASLPRETVDARVQGLDAGADDYLTKPFEMAELHCRLLALCSRGNRKDIGMLYFHDLEVNVQTGIATREGKVLNINKIQYQILLTLLKHAPALVSRSDLEYEIWGDDLPDNDILRSHLYQLRQIIDKPFSQAYIQTVHAKGIKLSIEE